MKINVTISYLPTTGLLIQLTEKQYLAVIYEHKGGNWSEG